MQVTITYIVIFIILVAAQQRHIGVEKYVDILTDLFDQFDCVGGGVAERSELRPEPGLVVVVQGAGPPAQREQLQRAAGQRAQAEQVGREHPRQQTVIVVLHYVLAANALFRYYLFAYNKSFCVFLYF